VRHGTCFRRRLSTCHAGAAPHSAVAELEVVRRCYTHPVNGTFILAYALPPLWVMALAGYVIISVPVTLAASVFSFAATFSPTRRRRMVRLISSLTLAFCLLNGALILWFVAADQNPPPPNPRDRLWALIMAATFILSAGACLRSWAALPPLEPPQHNARNA